jgi:hypothetical protein
VWELATQFAYTLLCAHQVLGTTKDMAKSGKDTVQPSSIDVLNAANFIEDNVVAGSERYGYGFYGPPCGGTYTAGRWRNNSAHGCLVGLWLRASDDSSSAGCTVLQNFTTHTNWDYGLISTRGITTDVQLIDVNVLDVKHTGAFAPHHALHPANETPRTGHRDCATPPV